MRVVLDVNVFVSAIIGPHGRVGGVLDLLRIGAFRAIYSAALVAELLSVLGRPRLRSRYGVTDGDVQALAELLEDRGELVVPTRRIEACRDPKDDAILEAGVAGNADVVVTGDADLLVLDPFEGIPILRPAEFLELFADR